MTAAVSSTFDLVAWLTDRALNDGEYLQPVKLHRLMYLAQAYFAVASRGRKLAPATFVAVDHGPVEPDVWRALAGGRPYIESVPPADDAETFLDSLWRRFGAYSADHLGSLLRSHPPYLDAFAKGAGTEISLAAMVAFYGRPRPRGTFAGGLPPVDEVLRPRTMRGSDGRPVSVRRWTPAKASRTRTDD